MKLRKTMLYGAVVLIEHDGEKREECLELFFNEKCAVKVLSEVPLEEQVGIYKRPTTPKEILRGYIRGNHEKEPMGIYQDYEEYEKMHDGRQLGRIAYRLTKFVKDSEGVIDVVSVGYFLEEKDAKEAEHEIPQEYRAEIIDHLVTEKDIENGFVRLCKTRPSVKVFKSFLEYKNPVDIKNINSKLADSEEAGMMR